MTKPKDDGVKRMYAQKINLYQEQIGSSDVEVIIATEHDREVGNLIYELSSANATIAELEAKLELKCLPETMAAIARLDKTLEFAHLAMQVSALDSELATARKVIDTLRAQRNYYCDLAQMPDKSYQEHIEECDTDIEAIERNDKQTQTEEK